MKRISKALAFRLDIIIRAYHLACWPTPAEIAAYHAEYPEDAA